MDAVRVVHKRLTVNTKIHGTIIDKVDVFRPFHS